MTSPMAGRLTLRWPWILGSFLALLTSQAFSAPSESGAPLARRMANFYRSPSSSVPSGQESLTTLTKFQIQSYSQNQLKVATTSEKNPRYFNINFDDVATDLHVSEWALTQAKTSLYTGPIEKHTLQKRLLSNEHVQILAFKKEWAEVYVPNSKLLGHLRWLDLKSNYFDYGLFFLMLSSPLKQGPAFTAPTLSTLPAGLRFKILGRQKGWLELEYKGQHGYVSNNAVLTKFDFAVSVANDQDRWLQYDSNDSKAVKKIKAIYTDSARAIVVRKNEFLNLHQSVKLFRENEIEWVQSQIPDHGLVWWKRNENDSNKTAKDTSTSPKNSDNSTTIEIAELLHRSIYSVALHPQNDKIGLVSAEGIFYSNDSVHWKKIEFFENQNHPVHIHTDGSLFVGSFRSIDQGKTFSEVMQWERITRIVEAALTKPPQFLKLLSLSSISTSGAKNGLEMILDTGYRKIHLVSSTSGETWLYKK